MRTGCQGPDIDKCIYDVGRLILYGILALLMVGVMLPALMRSPRVLETFVVGFAFYAIHTFIDSTNEPPTVVSVILEKSAKLFCSVFLAIGTFTGLIGAIWKHIIVNATPNDAQQYVAPKLPMLLWLTGRDNAILRGQLLLRAATACTLSPESR